MRNLAAAAVRIAAAAVVAATVIAAAVVASAVIVAAAAIAAATVVVAAAAVAVTAVIAAATAQNDDQNDDPQTTAAIVITKSHYVSPHSFRARGIPARRTLFYVWMGRGDTAKRKELTICLRREDRRRITRDRSVRFADESADEALDRVLPLL